MSKCSICGRKNADRSKESLKLCQECKDIREEAELRREQQYDAGTYRR